MLLPKPMTVAELIEKLKTFDPALPVGGSDDMGILEPIDYVELRPNFVHLSIMDGWREEGF